MSELAEIFKSIQQQHQVAMATMMEQMEQRRLADREYFEKLLEAKGNIVPNTTSTSSPSFSSFDPASELWADYSARFSTFVGAHSISDAKKAQVFLTNQSPTIFKLLTNLASQQTPAKEINTLNMDEIDAFMKTQFDPTRFIVRERFRFWSDMQRKPGETVHELAARIRQDAATCDFKSIKDSQDEALRQRFICSIGNEAVLKALFKMKDDDLTFARAVEVALETEDAAKVAKETAQGTQPKHVHKVSRMPPKSDVLVNSLQSKKKSPNCMRCGSTNHQSSDCRFKDTVCNFCSIKGHLEKVCMKKKKVNTDRVALLTAIPSAVNTVSSQQGSSCAADFNVPKLEVSIELDGYECLMEVDTATTGNFISPATWINIGRPSLHPSTVKYESASMHSLPIKGAFTGKVKSSCSQEVFNLSFNVVDVPNLNLLGRSATLQLGISVDQLMDNARPCHAVFDHLKRDEHLHTRCKELCDEFPDLWKPELGCINDFELEVEFNNDVQPIFLKPRPIPIAIQADLEKAIDDGIARGVWEPTQFNNYGTPVVPVKKALLPGQKKQKIRVCGDYSVTVNPQLKDHRHPLPLPEDLMHKLGGGFGFSKIDLADAYNQIKLAPESQRRLALSTHRGVLLQKRLPFGIKSAPGYFQQMMDQLTKDLPGVAVYLDDVLVSGKDASEHLHNLRQLLQRLDDKGLRCRLEKCQFAEPVVEYLGHQLSSEGIAKGPKVNELLNLPTPTDVSTLKSFLGSVQFYAKFLPSNLSTICEPLYRLTKKNTEFVWGPSHVRAFEQLKQLLSSNRVLVHYSTELPVGISCDASSIGIGAVLFHRFSDGSERPICNVSKTLTDTQRNYSQIQKEALAIVFGLKKFYQYLYGRKFILVTDHRPLLAMFGPGKPTPALAANRLARWALLLSQFDYTIEYRKTNDHANADVLSRLPTRDDSTFDEEESHDDVELVCAINDVDKSLSSGDNTIAKQSAKDAIISMVMRHTREGWPPKSNNEGTELQRFRQLADNLSTINGCLVYGSRLVIPTCFRRQVLEQLHTGHFGMQKMKQLARTAVYWPNIDEDIEATCRQCQPCGEHQNKPAKPAVHPWMMPERPWSRLHIDHAINFLGHNWLIIVDAFSKYPCIHSCQAVTAKATTELLEEDFAHFGYPNTIVSDNAPSFMSDEFQSWCKERGIMHITGAPYHPATNGAAERMVQTMKQALRKSDLSPRRALQQFLMMYRRTPTSTGLSPSELLNSRQLRTSIDALMPSPAHLAQHKQMQSPAKAQHAEKIAQVIHKYDVVSLVYALYFGPRRDRDARGSSSGHQAERYTNFQRQSGTQRSNMETSLRATSTSTSHTGGR